MTPSPPSRRRLLLATALAAALVVTALGVAALAERRALAAEESYVADRLANASCYDDWGTMEGAGWPPTARVTGVTADGLRVAVEVPYATRVRTDGGRTVYGDAVSEGVWAVSPLGVTRVRGDEVGTCESTRVGTGGRAALARPGGLASRPRTGGVAS